MTIHALMRSVTLTDGTELIAARDGQLELLSTGVVFFPPDGSPPTFIPLSQVQRGVYAERTAPPEP